MDWSTENISIKSLSQCWWEVLHAWPKCGKKRLYVRFWVSLSCGQHRLMDPDSKKAKSLWFAWMEVKSENRIALDLPSSVRINLHHILLWTRQQARILSCMLLTLPLGICAKNALDLILGVVLSTHSLCPGRRVDKDGWMVGDCWAISWQIFGRRRSPNASILLFLSNGLNPGAWLDRATPNFF